MKKRRFQPFDQGSGFLKLIFTASAPSGGNDRAVDSNDKQLGKIFGLTKFVHQRTTVDMGKIPTEIFRQLSEVFPLLARPVV
ncbi:hypothetical protein D3C75_563530 [compost metagenome]